MTFPVGQLPPDVLKALESGRTIDAIKRLRKATGLGLAEAKAVIDAHKRSQPPPVPSYGGASAVKAPDDGRVLPRPFSKRCSAATRRPRPVFFASGWASA